VAVGKDGTIISPRSFLLFALYNMHVEETNMLLEKVISLYRPSGAFSSSDEETCALYMGTTLPGLLLSVPYSS
jgi:hypothetical protein